MRFLRISILLGLAALAVAPAMAQNGLYGAPDAINLPRVEAAPGGYGGYAAPATYPAMPTAYSRNPQYGYPTSPTTPVDTAAGPAAASPAPPALPAPSGPPLPPAPALMEPPAAPMAPAAPAQPQAPSVVQQMLGEQGGYPQTGAGCGDGCFSGPASQLPCAECRSPWFASVYALVMTRDNGNRFWTTFENSVLDHQMLNSQDIELGWKWGGEVRFGCRFCCDQWAVEADYWTLDPFEGSTTVFAPAGSAGLGTPLQFGFVEFNGINAENWFGFGALQHTIYRRDEVHNAEVNLLRSRLLCGCEQPWGVDFLMGFRFFRFEEEFTFTSWADPAKFPAGMSHVAMMEDQIVNNFWGGQIGFNADWLIAPSLRLFVTPMFGVYDNHIEHIFRLELGDGTVAAPNPQYASLGTYPVSSTGDRVSFLTQIDVGVDWRFAEHWSARIGYRVLAATGVALADDQIPQYIVDIQDSLRHIQRNGDLILHGAFVGLTYNF